MSQLPFIIEGTSFPEIIILANPEYKQANSQRISTPPDSFLALQEVKDSPNRYSGELRVKLDTEKYPQSPYHIEIVCLVILSLSDAIPEELRRDWATRAAHSIAFPAVRELILTLTSRQPWGQFNIGLSSLAPPSNKAGKARKSSSARATGSATAATTGKRPAKASEAATAASDLKKRSTTTAKATPATARPKRKISISPKGKFKVEA